MLHITFKWKLPVMPEWEVIDCWVSSLQDCIDFYDLNDGKTQWEIISINEVEE